MTDEGQNRVLVDLPDRLLKAKQAVTALEVKLREAEELRQATVLLLAARPLLGDKFVLDNLELFYNAPD